MGQGARGRQYPWGFASCEDAKHSDLGALRRCLLIEVRQARDAIRRCLLRGVGAQRSCPAPPERLPQTPSGRGAQHCEGGDC